MPENAQPPAGPAGPQTPPQQSLKPHRGGVVLALGILGIVVCFICGIIAWVMGNNDIRQMNAGTMDSSGRGLTQAGKICGIISVILVIVGLVIWVLFFGLFAAGSVHMSR
jgi:uncharacterized membrane protein YidH (DUF202 family)